MYVILRLQVSRPLSSSQETEGIANAVMNLIFTLRLNLLAEGGGFWNYQNVVDTFRVYLLD